MWLKDSFKTWTFWPIESKLRKLSEVSFPGLLVISVFWINGMDAFKVRTCWSNKTVFSCRPSLLGNTLHKKIYVLKCCKITIVMLIKLKIHGLLWGGCWRRAFLKPRRSSFSWTVSTCLVKVFFKAKLFQHLLHLKGFFPSWILSICLLKCSALELLYSQGLHWKVFFSPCTKAICFFNFFFSVQ